MIYYPLNILNHQKTNNMKSKKFKTPSRTSPKYSKRGCLCPDGKTYSRKCCDGSLQAQGIGNITGTPE